MSKVREELSSFKRQAVARSHSLPRGHGPGGSMQGALSATEIPDPVMMSDEDDADFEARTKFPRIPNAIPAAPLSTGVRFQVP